jgi:hypothetical protein
MAFISGKVETDMKESGSNALNMEMELTFSQMEIHIKEILKKVKQMERVSIHGLTVQYMLENSGTV